jgi:hypothetical protein
MGSPHNCQTPPLSARIEYFRRHGVMAKHPVSPNCVSGIAIRWIDLHGKSVNLNVLDGKKHRLCTPYQEFS